MHLTSIASVTLLGVVIFQKYKHSRAVAGLNLFVCCICCVRLKEIEAKSTSLLKVDVLESNIEK